MPWKETKDPYKIWVSEVILQQTRVAQGTPYYLEFIDRFPTAKSLADADEDLVMKAWEGLGYYRRAKHLHQAAKQIVDIYEGIFPTDYDQILELKGVGPYTAAAIASFAFDLPYAVVDGNVIRVATRILGIVKPISDASVKGAVRDFADALLDKSDPGGFNQAIMDFGALQCSPKPQCPTCNLRPFCLAFKGGLASTIPVKKTQRRKRERWLNYLILTYEDRVYIRKRGAGDIWENLYEFWLHETPIKVAGQDILSKSKLPAVSSHSNPVSARQVLSHQIINVSFLHVVLKKPWPLLKKGGYISVKTKKLKNFAFPKVIDCYLKDKSVNLNI